MSDVSWRKLEEERPELAEFGRERLDGQVAYLATIRESGRPRAHPVTPVIGNNGCFIFVEPASLKSKDLLGNGQYCLHCTMNDSSGSSGEFQISGHAYQIKDKDIRAATESVASYKPSGSYLLFELRLVEVLATSYRGGRPIRNRWLVSETVES